jgi:hypothetical protein
MLLAIFAVAEGSKWFEIFGGWNMSQRSSMMFWGRETGEMGMGEWSLCNCYLYKKKTRKKKKSKQEGQSE